MTTEIKLLPIAYVKNMREDMSDDFWGNVLSEITIVDELPEECLEGIEAFSHLEILYHFNKADESKTLKGAAHPRENKAWPNMGIFAQRKKDRPNHIGSTIVKLLSRKGRTIIVSHLDADDGTPVLDIKPVVKEFLPEGVVTQPLWVSQLMKDYWK
jgi:tRNA-Thr(GGU) m(6)t(6)A37 methyltransferase TsaA